LRRPGECAARTADGPCAGSSRRPARAAVATASDRGAEPAHASAGVNSALRRR
jgi:hypothetical protein